MKYDPRIKDYHDIRCFASRNNRECLGRFGYFAEDISEFENLDKCAMGICFFKDGEEFPFYRFDHTTRRPAHPEKAYPLFCPASVIKEETEEKKEKKLRPYTLMEFIDKFTVGRPIKYRSKGEAGRENYLMLLGFWLTSDKDQTIPYISIGNFKYTLQELFEEYEWQEHYTEDFKPFGAEETE